MSDKLPETVTAQNRLITRQLRALGQLAEAYEALDLLETSLGQSNTAPNLAQTKAYVRINRQITSLNKFLVRITKTKVLDSAKSSKSPKNS